MYLLYIYLSAIINLIFFNDQLVPSPFDYADVVSTTTHKTLRAVRYLNFIIFPIFIGLDNVSQTCEERLKWTPDCD